MSDEAISRFSVFQEIISPSPNIGEGRVRYIFLENGPIISFFADRRSI
jgi:hypothetical protein